MFFLYFSIEKDMMSSRNEQKHLQAERFLRGVLNPLSPGERMPSLSALIRLSGLKRTVLESELRRLAQEKQIRILPKSGIYRRRHGKKEETVFVLAGRTALQKADGFMQNLLTALENIGKRHGMKTDYLAVSDPLLEQFPRIARELGIRHCFFLSALEMSMSRLVMRHCPHTVLILPRHPPCGGFAVLDSLGMSMEQLEYAIRLGHERIAYVHNLLPDEENNVYFMPNQTNRLLDYYRTMTAHGLPVEPEWVFSGYDNRHTFQENCGKMMHCRRPPGAVVISGSFVVQMYEYAKQEDIRIGRDLSLISCDVLSRKMNPQLTSITNSPEEIAVQGWQLMRDSMDGMPGYTLRAEKKIMTGASFRRI